MSHDIQLGLGGAGILSSSAGMPDLERAPGIIPANMAVGPTTELEDPPGLYEKVWLVGCGGGGVEINNNKAHTHTRTNTHTCTQQIVTLAVFKSRLISQARGGPGNLSHALCITF